MKKFFLLICLCVCSFYGIGQNDKLLSKQNDFLSTNMGIGFSSTAPTPTVQMNLAYVRWLNNKITLGLGLGIHANETSLSGIRFLNQFVSIHGQSRYYFNAQKKRIYSTGRVGYGIGFVDGFEVEGANAQGGLNAGAGLGIHFGSKRRFKYNLEVENHFQKASGLAIVIDEFGNRVNAKYELWVKRIVVKFGIDF